MRTSLSLEVGDIAQNLWLSLAIDEGLTCGVGTRVTFTAVDKLIDPNNGALAAAFTYWFQRAKDIPYVDTRKSSLIEKGLSPLTCLRLREFPS